MRHAPLDPFWIVVLICLLTVPALVLGFATLGHLIVDQKACYASWNTSGYRVRWTFWGDCQLSDDGQNWMPEKAFMRQHAEITLKH